MKLPEPSYREIRVLNRAFSLGEYNESWTKIERFLFLEIYNLIKEFYLNKTDADKFIESFSDESILVKLPISMIDKSLIKIKNRSKQLIDVAERLSQKRIRNFYLNEEGVKGFDFITIFPRITYDPDRDNNHIYIKVFSEIYEEIVPIESYCLLDLKLLRFLTKGSAVRIYEVVKSYAFRGTFTLTFTELRRQLGFYMTGRYTNWPEFNRAVLKPAVNNINNYKDVDIEVSYVKPRQGELIIFTVINHAKKVKNQAVIRSLDDMINPKTRQPNMMQKKYITTTLAYCQRHVGISDPEELTEWIVSDLINQQDKQGVKFSFKHSMNAISKQLRAKTYSKPFSHSHRTANSTPAIAPKLEFNEDDHNKIKSMYYNNEGIDAIRKKFTNEQLIVNRFGFIIEETDSD